MTILFLVAMLFLTIVAMMLLAAGFTMMILIGPPRLPMAGALKVLAVANEAKNATEDMQK